MAKRHCDGCGGTLTGKKAHGFVSNNGKYIYCSKCQYPKK